MLRRSILPKAQDKRIDVGLFDEETGEFFTARSQLLVLRFAVSKDHDCGFLSHFDQVLVILWAGRVFCDAPQVLLVGGTVRESVADVDAAVPPCPRKPATFRHAAIVHILVRSARVHHDEHGMRLCLIPRSDEPIAVAVTRTAEYYGAVFHVRAYG